MIKNPKFTVDIQIVGKKVQSTVSHTINEQVKQVCSWIADTENAQVREALIKMGWTPPKDENTTRVIGESSRG